LESRILGKVGDMDKQHHFHGRREALETPQGNGKPLISLRVGSVKNT